MLRIWLAWRPPANGTPFNSVSYHVPPDRPTPSALHIERSTVCDRGFYYIVWQPHSFVDSAWHVRHASGRRPRLALASCGSRSAWRVKLSTLHVFTAARCPFQHIHSTAMGLHIWPSPLATVSLTHPSPPVSLARGVLRRGQEHGSRASPLLLLDNLLHEPDIHLTARRVHLVRQSWERRRPEVPLDLLDAAGPWDDGRCACVVEDPPQRELAKRGRRRQLAPVERALVERLELFDGWQRDVAQVFAQP